VLLLLQKHEITEAVEGTHNYEAKIKKSAPTTRIRVQAKPCVNNVISSATASASVSTTTSSSSSSSSSVAGNSADFIETMDSLLSTPKVSEADKEAFQKIEAMGFGVTQERVSELMKEFKENFHQVVDKVVAEQAMC